MGSREWLTNTEHPNKVHKTGRRCTGHTELSLPQRMMKPHSLSLLAFLCALSLRYVAAAPAAADFTAYPSIPGTDDCTVAGGDAVLIPPRREVYDNGRIYDISHRYVPEMPVWDSKDGLGKDFLWLLKSMKNGSVANNSAMKLGVHTGTHVDAPGHFYDNYFDAGFDVDSLDLRVLNGKGHRSLFQFLYSLVISIFFFFFFFWDEISRCL